MVLMRQGCPKERHDAIAHHLVDRTLIPMHGRHHPLQHGIEEAPGLFGIALRQEFHGALEIGKQHGDLLALAFEVAVGSQDFLSQVPGGICFRNGE